MRRQPSPARSARSDVGGAVTGAVVAVVVLAAVAVGAFFYFGGEADVDIKPRRVRDQQRDPELSSVLGTPLTCL